jgi:hypothetical protein
MSLCVCTFGKGFIYLQTKHLGSTPFSLKYTGKPFSFRSPEGRVALVIEVEKAIHETSFSILVALAKLVVPQKMFCRSVGLQNGWRYFLEETDLVPGMDADEATKLRQARLERRESGILRPVSIQNPHTR